MKEFDVVIVGSGMVGAALANMCAASGMKVAVIEKFIPEPITKTSAMRMRVSAISVGSENLLREIGVWSHIVSTRVCPYKQLITWEQGDNKLIFSNELVGHSHLGHIIENDLVQSALMQKFSDNNVTLLSHSQVQSFKVNTDYVAISLASEEVLSAKLIVAADGGQSKVRQLAGIGVTGWNYRQQCFAINIQTKFEQQAATWQEFHSSGPRAFLPLAGNFASLIWYDSPKEIERLKSLHKSELKAAIQQSFPALPGDFEVVEYASFPLTRQHANDYVKERVVLVGDAAHTINPLAGQGVNIGFQDVAKLANELVIASKNNEDIGSMAVLKRYESDRKNKNLLMMSAMDLFYKTFSNDIPPIKLIRNIGLKVANASSVAKKQVLKYAMGIN